MAGLNVITTQDSIENYIKQEFPGYRVFSSDVVDDEYIQKNAGKVKPYIVLNWGGLRNKTTGGSFAGVRHDEYYSTVDIAVVAPNPEQARVAINIIVDKLIGWKPADSTPLRLESSMDAFGIPDRDGVPVVYLASYRLAYDLNMVDVGATIPQ